MIIRASQLETLADGSAWMQGLNNPEIIGVVQRI
jgi:hypothetical protein